MVDINDLPPKYQKQVRDKIADSTPVSQRHLGNVTLAEEETKGHNKRYRLAYHSKRHRLIDYDNLHAKYITDCLKKGGVLKDDSPRYVKSVTHTQEKIPRTEREETIITIEEV